MSQPCVFRVLVPLLACLALAACHGDAPVGGGRVSTANEAAAAGNEDGPPRSEPRTGTAAPAELPDDTDWLPGKVNSGEASISCDTDYAGKGDGEKLLYLDFFSVADAMQPCHDGGVVRLHYRGKIGADFTDLVERVTGVADRMGIAKRILDIDSTGGRVEDAMEAGDAIAGGHWTIWVREDAICHSACVLILVAGDERVIAGKVGIHRMVRVGSEATTRAELNDELKAVAARMKDYLQRNGAAVAIADLMMTVPNRSLRLLTDTELREYGLAGPNAAQDDLERIRLARKCGDDFVRRRDSYLRAYEKRCTTVHAGLDDRNACGLALRQRYGFPDGKCPDDSPLSEFDAAEVAVSPNPQSAKPQSTKSSSQ